MSNRKKIRKVIILDESVIKIDPQAMFMFNENNIIIPLHTLSPKHINSAEEFIERYNLHKFAESIDCIMGNSLFEGGISLGRGFGKLLVKFPIKMHPKILEAFPDNENENHIINIALNISRYQQKKNLTIITENTSLKLKARYFGIRCQTYRDFCNNLDFSYYDAFISYASEDKEYAKNIAEKLLNRNFNIWFDSFEIKVGDIILRSINKGLTKSRYGIVILSKAYFNKQWTSFELEGLIEKEMEFGKTILPIWYGINKKDILNYAPSFANKYSLDSTIYNPDDITNKLIEVFIAPNQPLKTDRRNGLG